MEQNYKCYQNLKLLPLTTSTAYIRKKQIHIQIYKSGFIIARTKIHTPGICLFIHIIMISGKKGVKREEKTNFSNTPNPDMRNENLILEINNSVDIALQL